MAVITTKARALSDQTCGLHPRERCAIIPMGDNPSEQQKNREVNQMTTTLSAEERQVSHVQTFRKSFGVLHAAAVGVILCRTREPYRAADTLRAFAWAERDTAGDRLDFRQWDCINGWQQPNPDNPLEVKTDGKKNLPDALALIGGTNGVGGFSNGVFAAHYPHFGMNSPPVIAALKIFARQFSEDKRRLVLLVPLGFTLPAELRDDIVVLDFETPSYRELHDALTRVIGDVPEKKRPVFSAEQTDTLLANGAGMTLHEFDTAIARALVENRKDLPNVEFRAVAEAVMRVKTEAVKRTDVLEVIHAEDMSNVGGLANLKDWVRKRGGCFTQEARDYGIEPPKGIMLAGPPGTGKSLVAKAIAREMGLPLIKFDVARVFASLVGQSEERVESALKMVENMAPAVLMIDEVDKALGGITGGGGDSGVGKRVLGKILTWLQDNKKPIFTVVSANRVEDLPSELLRRGRLDEIFSVSIPDEDERLEVLQIHLRKRGHADVTDLADAVARSEGYVPAEIEAAVKDALVEAFTTKVPITGKLIADQLAVMVPLSQAFAEQFEHMKNWAENNARPANGPSGGDASRSTSPVRTRKRVKTASGGRDLSLDG